MILSGEKTEEYREIKKYFQKQLCRSYIDSANYCKLSNCNNCDCFLSNNYVKFNTITFSNGYSKNRPQFEIDFRGFEIRYGKEEWGAKKGKKYFVLKLGNVTMTKNIPPKERLKFVLESTPSFKAKEPYNTGIKQETT